MGFVTDVVLPLALVFIMLALGLGLTFDDFVRAVRRPLDFAVGAASQIIVLPVIAFLLASIWPMAPELALGLMIEGLPLQHGSDYGGTVKVFDHQPRSESGENLVDCYAIAANFSYASKCGEIRAFSFLTYQKLRMAVSLRTRFPFPNS